MKRVSIDTTYRVAQGTVRLSITIGDAQIGGSVVHLGDRELAIGDISNLTIGTGSALKGQTLSIKSVVTDTNDATNRTSVSYRLTGGKTDQSFSQTATVDEDGDSVVYRATVSLT